MTKRVCSQAFSTNSVIFKIERHFSEFLKELCTPVSALKATHNLCVYWKLVEIVHRLLLENRSISKRDIYYSECRIARNQRETDEAIKRLCATLSVTRSELLITAAPHGLIMGNLQVTFQNGSIFGTYSTDAANTIPQRPEDIVMITSTAKFIMIVEKDTIFHHLQQHQFLQKFPQSILLSGSGFPGQTFQALLLKLKKNLKNVPILILVDADPYGIHIALCHMNACSVDDSAETSFTLWIGVSMEDIHELRRSNTLEMNAADKRRATNIHKELERSMLRHESRSILLNELSYMLETNKKAEIESLCFLTEESTCYLCEQYLPRRILAVLERQQFRS